MNHGHWKTFTLATAAILLPLGGAALAGEPATAAQATIVLAPQAAHGANDCIRLGVRSRFELAALTSPTAASSHETTMLSEREYAVLTQLVRGQCNKAIAYELQLAEGSVSTYLKRAAVKLGVRGRMMLIHRGRQLLAAGELSVAA